MWQISTEATNRSSGVQSFGFPLNSGGLETWMVGFPFGGQRAPDRSASTRRRSGT